MSPALRTATAVREATGARRSYLSPDGTDFIKEPPGNLPIGPDAPGADYCFNVVAHNAQTPLASGTGGIEGSKNMCLF